MYNTQNTYTSLSVQRYCFHHLPRHLMQCMYSFRLDECAHFVMLNHCCWLLYPTLDDVEQFDSVYLRMKRENGSTKTKYKIQNPRKYYTKIVCVFYINEMLEMSASEMKIKITKKKTMKRKIASKGPHCKIKDLGMSNDGKYK